MIMEEGTINNSMADKNKELFDIIQKLLADGELYICEFSSEYNGFGNPVIKVPNELEERPNERLFEAFDEEELITAWRELPTYERSK